MHPQLQALANRLGIHFMGAESAQFQLPEAAMAMDAQPALVTVSNAGIPAYLTTFVDSKLINVLISPMKAATILGDGSEVKKGNWLTETAMFETVEATGETSAYGDYNNNGHAGVNVNFPQRQSFHYQVITEYGEKQMERAGLAKLDLVNRLNMASALTLNKFQNKSYFFGVANLQNYGLLNDPSLIAPITPSAGTAWATKDGQAVYTDIQSLYAQLVLQSNSLVDLDTPMVLVMSAQMQVNLTKTNQYNVNVMTLLKTNFPNLRIETAPEYATAAGNLVQLIVPELDGQKTAEVAFTEKLRAHPVVVGLSNFSQKKSQGTWGAIIYRPFLIAQMLGV